jgi:hypothetical protein
MRDQVEKKFSHIFSVKLIFRFPFSFGWLSVDLISVAYWSIDRKLKYMAAARISLGNYDAANPKP